MSTGNYSKAKDVLTQIIEHTPDHWSSFSTLGAIEVLKGNYPSAIKYIKAIPENILSWRALANLGIAYFFQKKYSQSLEISKTVLQIVPNDISTISLISEIHLMLGNEKEARETFQRIKFLTEGRTDLKSRRFNAISQANLGEFSKAVSITHKLLQENPGDINMKYAAAQIYALAGEVSSASYYIEELLKQGMSADWFQLPAHQQLCTQKHPPPPK